MKPAFKIQTLPSTEEPESISCRRTNYKRRLWCFFLAAFLASIAYGHDALAIDSIGPRMVLDEYFFDFKDVKEGEAIEHTFRVRNQGDRTLQIKDVKPG